MAINSYLMTYNYIFFIIILCSSTSLLPTSSLIPSSLRLLPQPVEQLLPFHSKSSQCGMENSCMDLFCHEHGMSYVSCKEQGSPEYDLTPRSQHRAPSHLRCFLHFLKVATRTQLISLATSLGNIHEL